MRKKIVAGNWKMNKDVREGYQFTKRLLIKLLDITGVEVILFPSFTALFHIHELLRDSPVQLGGQNLHWERSGAYTGEISASMLESCGCTHVIIGHSERRHIFGESDEDVHKKVVAALNGKLVPVICIGETLEEREAEDTDAVLRRQLTSAFGDLSADHLSGIIIAYEPVWAIGTGVNASPEQAEEAHRFIRSVIRDRHGPDLANRTQILYGGSVKSDNAEVLITSEEIDGFLIGGASLKEDEFSKITHIVEKKIKRGA